MKPAALQPVRLAQQAAAQLRRAAAARPSLAIILGSGFHSVLRDFDAEATIPYRRLPGFPQVAVQGHAGQVLIGRLGGTPVLICSGRSHFYEGRSLEEVTFAVRVLAACGIRDLLLTNAAGGVNRAFKPGHFMVIRDHINLMGVNPLRGEPPPGLPRFVDMTEAYDPALSAMLLSAARSQHLKLHQGVYLAVAGPSYETPAEIRAFAKLGADAVGMSTVPEALVARQHGLSVAGLSCITNQAAGLAPGRLSHSEVLEVARTAGDSAAKLLTNFARIYAKTR